MYLSQLHVAMRQQRYKDLLQEAEQKRPIRVAGLQPTASAPLYRKAANWLGTQLVSWGRSLLHSDKMSACGKQPAR